MKIDAKRLRGFLDCMHAEADERDRRSVQIREIVKAAREAGFDAKAVRKVFARERMDEGEKSRLDELLETYEGALGAKGRALRAIEAGAGVGEAADAAGLHRATLARARHVANQPSNATRETADGTPPGGSGERADNEAASGAAPAIHSDADRMRAQIPVSTDPAWLEREAERLELPAHLDRRQKATVP